MTNLKNLKNTIHEAIFILFSILLTLHFFSLQRYFQMILVIIAVLCVPWMLLVKPIYLLVKHKREKNKVS